MKKLNHYACAIPEPLYVQCPKAVFAAIAISALTCGGDWIERADERVRGEWWNLYDNGIVPQKPPFPRTEEHES